MPIFLTGATGFIGKKMALRLAESGETVHVLARNPQKAADLTHSRIRVFKGDILEPETLVKAMQGCESVIHMASFVDLWSKDPAAPYVINVQGTVNVMEAAMQTGATRVVVTSTAGSLGPSQGEPIHEESVRIAPYFVDYEASKAMAEERALRYVSKGLEVIIVHPTRVFGPGEINKSNGFVKLMHMYLYKGRTVFPGRGDKSGNYVFVDDVIEGHILALKKGSSGSRYILGGENATLTEFFGLVAEESGKKARIFRIPMWMIMGIGRFQEWKARWFSSPPLITRAFAKRYLTHWNNSIEKARRELGFQPRSLREGIRETIEWLRKEQGEFKK